MCPPDPGQRFSRTADPSGAGGLPTRALFWPFLLLFLSPHKSRFLARAVAARRELLQAPTLGSIRAHTTPTTCGGSLVYKLSPPPQSPILPLFRQPHISGVFSLGRSLHVAGFRKHQRWDPLGPIGTQLLMGGLFRPQSAVHALIMVTPLVTLRKSSKPLR